MERIETESFYRNRYRILRKLGEGGSSEVFMGIDTKSGRTVTIKMFKKAALHGGDIAIAAREEADILGKLDHPAIPKVIEVYEDAFVLEHIPGNSLEKVMKARGAFSEKEAVKTGMELLNILKYLHGLKSPIIYRDLKPANIIVRPDGHVALIDFGTAREYSPSENADTNNLGTCGYAAPEQYGCLGQTDDRTDIYCFGRTMNQMLSGSGSAGAIGKKSFILQKRGAKVSPELLKILEKCTMPDRDDRFSSCKEIEKALLTYPRKVKLRKTVLGIKLAFASAILALMVSGAVTYYDEIKSYAAEDITARVPAVKERLGNAGIRIKTALSGKLASPEIISIPGAKPVEEEK